MGPAATLKLIAALLSSAIGSALAIGISFTVLQAIEVSQPLQSWLIGILGISFVALLFTLPAAFVIGLPIYLFLDARGRVSAFSLSIGGAVSAMVPFAFFVAKDADDFSWDAAPLAAVLFACGCFGGWLFWRLQCRERPQLGSLSS